MVQFAVGCVYQLPWLRNVSFQILPTMLASSLSCQQCHDACPRAKHRSRIVAAHLCLGGGSTGHTSTCRSAQSEVGRNRFCAAQSTRWGGEGISILCIEWLFAQVWYSCGAGGVHSSHTLPPPLPSPDSRTAGSQHTSEPFLSSHMYCHP